MPTFTPPTVDDRPRHPLWPWLKNRRGRCVYRSGGQWYEVDEVAWDDIANADVVAVADRPGGEDWRDGLGDRYVFLGARTYTVSSAVGTALTDAGYTVT